jgi:hypothetical protein
MRHSSKYSNSTAPPIPHTPPTTQNHPSSAVSTSYFLSPAAVIKTDIQKPWEKAITQSLTEPPCRIAVRSSAEDEGNPTPIPASWINTPQGLLDRNPMKAQCFHMILVNTPRGVLHRDPVKPICFHVTLGNTPRGVLHGRSLKPINFHAKLGNTPRGVLHRDPVKPICFHVTLGNTPRGLLHRDTMKSIRFRVNFGSHTSRCVMQGSCETNMISRDFG